MRLGWHQKYLKVRTLVSAVKLLDRLRFSPWKFFPNHPNRLLKGSRYTEKCDVYSWGVTLWEVLTRRVPFEEIGESMCVMWAVYHGSRPPINEVFPDFIRNLITA